MSVRRALHRSSLANALRQDIQQRLAWPILQWKKYMTVTHGESCGQRGAAGISEKRTFCSVQESAKSPSVCLQSLFLSVPDTPAAGAQGGWQGAPEGPHRGPNPWDDSRLLPNQPHGSRLTPLGPALH